MRTEIRNDRNMLIGWIEESAGQYIATHIKKGFCGRYSSGSNITFDKSGKIFCYGNGTDGLLRFVDRGLI